MRREPEPLLRLSPEISGVGKGTRTLDTRNHNPVLSRLSYTTIGLKWYAKRDSNPGLLLRRQLLYPAELLAHINSDKPIRRKWSG